MPAYKRCIIFLADGARPDVLNEELQKGNLPNIARYMVDKGTNETILTVFPSTTGPAYLPFLTGCYPGTCNVPGIRWFDKPSYAKRGWGLRSFRSYVGLETYLMPHDIRPEIKTAFELFDRPLSIFNMVNRGVNRGHNKTKFSRIWYIYYAHLTDRWSFVDQAASRKLLEALDEDPDFSFVVFPGIDEYSHRSSPFNPRTYQAYRELDSYIGATAEKLQAKGWLDDTLMIIVSDHGLSETKTHFDVGPYLEEKGTKTFFYTQIFKWDFDAASMISGNGMAHLYFKGERGWDGRMSFEELSSRGLLLDDLRMKPEIALVAAQGADGSYHVLTDKGHGHFKVAGEDVHYQWKQTDPLGIFNEPSRKKQMTLDESARLSFNSHFPDVFNQLRQVFKSPRTGDVILSAKTGCDLRKRYEHPEHKASHGSLCPEHMKIPLVMNHPIQRGPNDRPIRSVDIFPTLLQLMGKPIPPGIDGVSLV